MSRERNRWRVVVNRLAGRLRYQAAPADGAPSTPTRPGPSRDHRRRGASRPGGAAPPHGPQRDLENQGPAAPEREVPSTPTGGAGRSGRSPAPGVGVVWGVGRRRERRLGDDRQDAWLQARRASTRGHVASSDRAHSQTHPPPDGIWASCSPARAVVGYVRRLSRGDGSIVRSQLVARLRDPRFSCPSAFAWWSRRNAATRRRRFAIAAGAHPSPTAPAARAHARGSVTSVDGNPSCARRAEGQPGAYRASASSVPSWPDPSTIASHRHAPSDIC